MGESVFEVVKQSVTAREAAELYGIAVGRGGMACCPFHDDRHPSMKVDTRFHCFGCGADGDVIDFTARLYDLSPKGAAEKLAQDFGLSYDSKAPIRRSYVRQKTEAQVRKEKREHGWRVLTDYYHLLRKWEADYSPKTADEDPHPRFLEAVQKKDYMGYLLDTFLDSSTEEQDQWIAEHTAEISAIEGRVKMDHQQEREQAFLGHKGDCFAIYQVKHTDELRDIRYEGLEWIKSIGQMVQRDNYDLVYTAPLAPGDLKGSVLDNLEYRFNNEHPADYRHPSMSVSDIVAIKRDGKVSCHYCDSFGFAEVAGFLPDNPLKNAEMSVEDDYGMIDGILNNGQRQPPQRELPEKRKSVVEQLKSQPKPEHKKSAPKKSAEREL